MKIAVLLACYNRKDITLNCLGNLHRQILPTSVCLDIFLLDDASTDGTEAAVHRAFPDVRVIKGDGNLFWCGGMRTAWEIAAKEDPDYYLLLNDDTKLSSDAIAELLEITPSPEIHRIAVASISDPDTGVATYGGRRRCGDLIIPDGKSIKCDTFNGNCVLVPRCVFQKIGKLHNSYRHAIGDYDYGYMATRNGIDICASKRFLGTCQKNSIQGTWMDTTLPIIKRLQLLQSPKGLPWKEWFIYNYRNDRLFLPWRMITPFLRILLGR